MNYCSKSAKAAGAEAMRRILIDRARRKLTMRHGGSCERVDLDGHDLAAPGPDEQLLAVHEALSNLAKDDPVQAGVLKLRYFVGGGADTMTSDCGNGQMW